MTGERTSLLFVRWESLILPNPLRGEVVMVELFGTGGDDLFG